ncbi:senescence-associated protein [Galdieria sulphuraria]|uniref:Senescence-associated protein n=1 Tax=Galdieria sulphuraria TaxID=130081 RepID=M2XQQ4_GALSU|nr:senescence-associated protein [Galdieria sulphuraria]|eukprot:XP_005702478.1 senescence-associated protein [Galdieria sulphuraria]
MIGRADIEGSKSNVARNAWLPQASYPCGSIGHAFTVSIRTENINQMSLSPFGLYEISGLIELILGHLRCLVADVPPQPNSPSDNVLQAIHLSSEKKRLDS